MKVKLEMDSHLGIPSYRISPAPDSELAWNWNAGGGCYVFQSRYVVLIQRSPRAPTNPGKWTVPTGMAEQDVELHDPIRLLRETFEELILMNKQGELLIPEFSPPDIELNELARSITLLQAKVLNLPFRGERTLPISWPNQSWLPSISVHLPGRPALTRNAYLHAFEATRSINTIFVLECPDQRPEGIEFFDGELDTASLGTPTPLRRSVRVFDLQAKDWEENELTPHARGCLEWIKKGIDS